MVLQTHCPSQVDTMASFSAIDGSLINSQFIFSTAGGLLAGVIPASTFRRFSWVIILKVLTNVFGNAESQGLPNPKRYVKLSYES